ncbi:MAG: hypothetical protein P1V36_10395 [Planctomycetota bacterium]|nr:hypothetical protein [Planctomycetota bacterium]
MGRTWGCAVPPWRAACGDGCLPRGRAALTGRRRPAYRPGRRPARHRPPARSRPAVHPGCGAASVGR